jgi:signal transduction histidine kinase
VARIRRLDLSVTLAPQLRRIKADREQIERLVLDLIGNALKFTPEGGRVAVAVEAAADGVVLLVSDNGIGIPEHEMESVFTPRFRSSLAVARGIGGEGLGLARAKEVVERHDGRITVDSTEGTGTTVWVSLPVEPGGQGGFAAWRRSHQSPTKGSTNGTNP